MKIRKATMDDLKELTEIEAKCFLVEEAATEESFKGRLEIYPVLVLFRAIFEIFKK